MDSATYDKIVVDGEYADELSRRINLMNESTGSMLTILGLVNGFRYPLTKGILHLEYGGAEKDMQIYFNLDDDITGNGRFRYVQFNASCEWTVQGGKVKLVSSPANPRNKDKLVEVVYYLTNLFKAVMHRMHEKPEVVTKDEQRVPKVRKGKVKHGKKHKNRTVYVRQTVYRVSSPAPPHLEGNDEKVKRDYERKTFRWTRAGHYRKLRNGEVRWFPEKEIILDPDAQREAKTYKIRKGKGE